MSDEWVSVSNPKRKKKKKTKANNNNNNKYKRNQKNANKEIILLFHVPTVGDHFEWGSARDVWTGFLNVSLVKIFYAKTDQDKLTDEVFQEALDECFKFNSFNVKCSKITEKLDKLMCSKVTMQEEQETKLVECCENFVACLKEKTGVEFQKVQHYLKQKKSHITISKYGNSNVEADSSDENDGIDILCNDLRVCEAGKPYYNSTTKELEAADAKYDFSVDNLNISRRNRARKVLGDSDSNTSDNTADTTTATTEDNKAEEAK